MTYVNSDKAIHIANRLRSQFALKCDAVNPRKTHIVNYKAEEFQRTSHEKTLLPATQPDVVTYIGNDKRINPQALIASLQL